MFFGRMVSMTRDRICRDSLSASSRATRASISC